MKNRDNSYYLERLERAGRHDLLERIDSEEITVFRASVIAGFRKAKDAPSRSDQIAYHWQRANKREQMRFLVNNWKSVGPIVGEIIKQKKVMEAQKPSE